MTPNTPRFPNDPMDYDLPPHTDCSAGCVAEMPQAPLLTGG
jgi:hypothetical protein